MRFRLTAELENYAHSSQLWNRASRRSGNISLHYVFSFHSHLWQLRTKSSSPVSLVLTFLCAKEPSFPNSLNCTCLFGGKEVWKWIWIRFTTTSPVKTAKSQQGHLWLLGLRHQHDSKGPRVKLSAQISLRFVRHLRPQSVPIGRQHLFLEGEPERDSLLEQEEADAEALFAKHLANW